MIAFFALGAGLVLGALLGRLSEARKHRALVEHSLGAFLLSELDLLDSMYLPDRPQVANTEHLWAIELRYQLGDLRARAMAGRSIDRSGYLAMLAKAREDFGGLPKMKRTAVSLWGKRWFAVTYFCPAEPNS